MTSNRSPVSGLSPRDAAAYWLARHDADPSTASDPDFLAWLAESERHTAAWARAEALWDRAADDLRDDPLAQALRASALAARPPAWPKALAAACVVAAVLASAVGGWRYWAAQEPSASQVASTPAIQLATLVGERRTVTLADGTRLDLDSDTRLEATLSGKARHLRLLKGRTYIQVAHDAARPFSVEAGDQTIIDRGTEFTVRFDPEVFMVTLVQGGVSVGPSGRPADYELTPGQRLIMRPGSPATVETVDLKTALAWRDGFVEFSDTPLSEAVAEMNRHGGRRLVIADPRVGALKISGRFKLGEPERFLRTVSMLLPVQAVRVDETLEIRAAPSEPPR